MTEKNDKQTIKKR